MNISQAMLSEMAPDSFSAKDQNNALINELLRNDPDVIALQECPDPDWAMKSGGFKGYRSVGSTPSHAGHVVLLVRESIAVTQGGVIIVDDLPMVSALLLMNGKLPVMVASVHLEPFQQGSFARQDQVDQLLELAATTPSNHGPPSMLVFAGDTNMREEEDSVIEGKGLVDVWKQAGAKNSTRYTWDTVDHGSSFNAYYGRSSTRQYQRRYDRMYYRCLADHRHEQIPRRACSVEVIDFSLIANTPIQSKIDHFLSDHFGVAAEIRWSSD